MGATNIVWEGGQSAMGAPLIVPAVLTMTSTFAKGGRRLFEQSLDARLGCDVGSHGEDSIAFRNGLDGFGRYVEQGFISNNGNDAFCSLAISCCLSQY